MSTATYLEPADTRHAFSDALTICARCRRCADRCAVFPAAFDLIDELRDGDPGRMTPFQQDLIADGCVHCGDCTAACPHGPSAAAMPEGVLDFAAVMLRVAAMRHAEGAGPRSGVATWLRRRAVLPPRPCPFGGLRGDDGSPIGCCGGAALFDGDVTEFDRCASRLIVRLADDIRNGRIGGSGDVVIEATCRTTLGDLVEVYYDTARTVGRPESWAEVADEDVETVAKWVRRASTTDD